MRFTDPLWLLLFLPLAAGLAWSWQRIHGIARPRKVLAFLVRACLAGAMILALSGPQSYRPHRGVATIFVVDRSDSVDSAGKERALATINESLGKMGVDDVSGVLVAGSEARMEVAVGRMQSINAIRTKVDPGSTDLSAAVRLASANFPDGKAKRIVLLSDGNETAGDLMGAAQAASADGIEIDFVPLGAERKQEALVVAVEAPDQARLDQPISVRAVIESNVEQTVLLDLDRDGKVVKSMETRLRPGRNSVLMQDKPPSTGFQRYRIMLRADRDEDVRNNIGSAFVNVKGRPKVLVLQEDPADRTLASAIQGRGIDVQVLGPGNAPVRPESYQAYDAIVLNDFNAQSFISRQQDQIQAVVRDSGMGFAMVGGENSFLPGGYYGSSIAEILPVDLDVRERKDFPSTSIAIIVDCSGSMGMIEDGQQKIRLAAQAAEQTINLMGQNDRVAVAGSSDGVEFLVPFMPLGDKQAAIAGARRLAVSGGGIYIRPSIERAEEELNKETSKVRHFILLADGNDSTDQEGAIAIASRMRMNKITTTVVAIGNGSDVPFLKSLAAAGGGRFYLASKASQLPAIFTQDASLVSRSAIEEGAFVPKIVGDDEIINGIDGMPPLLAYCLTDSRPLARTILRTHKDDPLLAKWQYGLGTSLAFTSDAKSRWASRWVNWGGYDAFWSQAIRAIVRRGTDNRYQATASLEAGKGKLQIKSFDRLGNPVPADAVVKMTGPSGSQIEVPIVAEAPGVYGGEFSATEVGSYIVTVAEPGAGAARVTTTGFNVPYPPEYRATKPNLPLLNAVAEGTNGRDLKQPALAFRPAIDPGASISDLWWMFVGIALFMLPVDIAIRRIALPISEMWLAVRRKFARTPVPTSATRLEQLKAAKSKRIEPARAGTDAREPVPVEPKQASREPSEKPKADAAQKPGGTTAKSLLEAKRKRQG